MGQTENNNFNYVAWEIVDAVESPRAIAAAACVTARPDSFLQTKRHRQTVTILTTPEPWQK
jgi:hypothetical protein